MSETAGIGAAVQPVVVRPRGPGNGPAGAAGGAPAVAPSRSFVRMSADAVAAAIRVIDNRQLGLLLSLLAGERATPAVAGPPLAAAPVAVRSAAGVVTGPLVVPGSVWVPRAEIEADHRGTAVKAFAVEDPDGRLRVVLVRDDWSAGLPAGKQAADVVADALTEAVHRALGRPHGPRVEARSGPAEMIALQWVGASPSEPPPRVAPLLDNAGFGLFAEPARLATAAAALASPNSVAGAAGARGAGGQADGAGGRGGWAPWWLVGVITAVVAGLAAGGDPVRALVLAVPAGLAAAVVAAVLQAKNASKGSAVSAGRRPMSAKAASRSRRGTG